VKAFLAEDFLATPLDVSQAFNLERNLSSIRKLMTADGGKSGEFFYFTFDQKFILKIITNEELQVFWKMGPQYFDYIR
jgi:hypothetical protein